MSVPSTPSEVAGLLLSDDMIFTSRITGTARDLGLTIKPGAALIFSKNWQRSRRRGASSSI